MDNKKKNKHSTKLAVVDKVARLKKGSNMVKVRKGGKQFRRHYMMDEQLLTFFQSNTQKGCTGASDIEVSINDIQDVRAGPYSDIFVKSFNKLGVKEDNCFSIVYGRKHQTLDLVADSVEERDLWLSGLKHLLKKLSQADLLTKQEIWVKEMFKYADKNGDGELSIREIVSLLKYLSIEVDYEQAKRQFEAANTNKTNMNKKGEHVLDMEEFVIFYRNLTKREEIEALFNKYNFEGQYLEADEMQEFLDVEEFISASIEDCEKIIQRFEPIPSNREQLALSIDGFNAFINCPVMDIFNIDHRDVYMDMKQPMSHYWIDSSHNTYLTADQLVGPSAVEAYIRALKRGCRCVELDVWDGPTGDPVVYHGHTLTSKISFKDIIQAVSQYAHEASDYPVILSIENHCSVEQQERMAQHMRNILKEKLYTTPYPADLKDLPSPESLKFKILVKGKKLPDNQDADEVSDEDEAADIEDDNVKQDVKVKKKHTKMKLNRNLSDCVTICQSVGFKGFEYARNHYNCKQMSSYAESKAEALAESQPKEWIKHNTFQLSRTYPGGLRTDSSNYNPIPFWNVGCQIVALNYQTPDDPMMIYKGRFRDNGGSGYILKPEFLLSSTPNIDPNGKNFPKEMKQTLKLRIVSGYQLPKGKSNRDILDPYVRVVIAGVKVDCQSQKTEHVENNGFHPIWDKTMTFEVNCPDLAVVWFQVLDYESVRSNVLVAQYALPFNSIMQGYRTVHLRTKHGEPIFGAALFVHARIV